MSKIPTILISACLGVILTLATADLPGFSGPTTRRCIPTRDLRIQATLPLSPSFFDTDPRSNRELVESMRDYLNSIKK